MKHNAVERRRFLSLCAGGLLAVIGVLVVAPVVAFVTSPLRKVGGSPVGGIDYSDAGPLESLPIGQWTLVPLEIVRQDGWIKERESRSVWVRRGAAGDHELQVLSPICTHLGCPIARTTDASQFRCPCHGGIFDTDGKLLSGPPPRNMDALDFRLSDGHLWVRWQDFKISVPERVAVQV